MIRQTICALHFFSGFIPLSFFLLPLFSLFLFLSASFLTPLLSFSLSLLPASPILPIYVSSVTLLVIRLIDDRRIIPKRARRRKGGLHERKGRMKIFYESVPSDPPPIIRRDREGTATRAHTYTFPRGGKSCFLAGSAYRSNFSRVYSYLSAGMKFHRAGIPFADVSRRKVRSG